MIGGIIIETFFLLKSLIYDQSVNDNGLLTAAILSSLPTRKDKTVITTAPIMLRNIINTSGLANKKYNQLLAIIDDGMNNLKNSEYITYEKDDYGIYVVALSKFLSFHHADEPFHINKLDTITLLMKRFKPLYVPPYFRIITFLFSKFYYPDHEMKNIKYIRVKKDTIGAECGLSLATVSRHLDTLVEAGVLGRIYSRQKNSSSNKWACCVYCDPKDQSDVLKYLRKTDHDFIYMVTDKTT